MRALNSGIFFVALQDGRNKEHMYQKATGIVLHTLKYNDTSVIADIYTEQNGRMSFLAAVSRSRKSPVRTTLFQPLSCIEFETDIRPGNSLHRIREVKSAHPFRSIPYHPYKTAIVLLIAEFLYRALREEEQNLPLYMYLLHSLLWLDECESRFANFHLVFLIRLSRFIGLYPNTDSYRPGACFDLLNACFVPDRPAHGFFLAPEEAEALRQLTRANYETMHLFALNRTQRNRCLTAINEYYRLHLPDFPVLKSPDVLQTLFG